VFLGVCILHFLQFVSQGAPTNDNFASRTILAGTNILQTFTVSGATIEPGEPAPNGPDRATIWYQWRAEFSGGVAVGAQSGVFVPSITVYVGPTFSSLHLVSTQTSASQTGFRALEGQLYQIVIGVPTNSDGNGTLSLKHGPANDDFEQRFLLSGPNASSVSTFWGATVQPGEPTFGLVGFTTLWWEWVAPASGSFYVEASATDLAVFLAGHLGTSFNNLARTMFDSDGDGTSARIGFQAQANESYIFVVDSASVGPFGSVRLTIGPGPINDRLTNRTMLPSGPISLISSVKGATRDYPDPVPGPYPTVWYEWAATNSGGWQVSLQSPGVAAVFEAARPSNAVAVATADGPVSFRTISGTNYFIGLSAPGDSLPPSVSYHSDCFDWARPSVIRLYPGRNPRTGRAQPQRPNVGRIGLVGMDRSRHRRLLGGSDRPEQFFLWSVPRLRAGKSEADFVIAGQSDHELSGRSWPEILLRFRRPNTGPIGFTASACGSAERRH
jgi:hypothetical protein